MKKIFLIFVFLVGCVGCVGTEPIYENDFLKDCSKFSEQINLNTEVMKMTSLLNCSDNFVTNVKNQAPHGTCGEFAETSALETMTGLYLEGLVEKNDLHGDFLNINLSEAMHQYNNNNYISDRSKKTTTESIFPYELFPGEISEWNTNHFNENSVFNSAILFSLKYQQYKNCRNIIKNIEKYENYELFDIIKNIKIDMKKCLDEIIEKTETTTVSYISEMKTVENRMFIRPICTNGIDKIECSELTEPFGGYKYNLFNNKFTETEFQIDWNEYDNSVKKMINSGRTIIIALPWNHMKNDELIETNKPYNFQKRIIKPKDEFEIFENCWDGNRNGICEEKEDKNKDGECTLIDDCNYNFSDSIEIDEDGKRHFYNHGHKGHIVNIIGYIENEDITYFIVKNSWGDNYKGKDLFYLIPTPGTHKASRRVFGFYSHKFGITKNNKKLEGGWAMKQLYSNDLLHDGDEDGVIDLLDKDLFN